MKYARQLIVWAMSLGVAGASRADFPVAENGQPKCVVVAGVEFASQAKSLTGYLEQMTGAKIPVVSNTAAANGQPVILLEKVDKVPGSSTKVTARQAYRIKADDKTLRLTGGSDFGVTYAVWGLIEDHLGCRFYTFKGNSQPDFEIVPKKPTLAIGKLDDFQEPAFMQRGFIWWPAADGWVVKNRGGGYPGDNTAMCMLMAHHNFYKLLPPDDGNDMAGIARKGWFKDHPEWAPLTDGKRQPSWAMGFCYSNPELPKALAEGLRGLIEQRKAQKGAKYDPAVPVSMAQGDGFAACECETCRKIVAEEESWAGPLFLMCNRTIEILEKTYPDQMFVTHAYFETLKAPKKLRPHKNLYVNIVSSDLSQNPAGDNVGRIVGNPAMRAYEQALRDWPKIAPDRVSVWDWRISTTEWPTLFYLADNERYWQECGVAATLPQPCSENAWRAIFCWLHLKLAWNPQADADKLIRQFLADYYGPKAAPILYDYFKLTRKAYEDSLYMPSVCRSTGWTEAMNAKIYQPYIPGMVALMDQALAAAKTEADPVYARHMTEAMVGSIDHVHLADAKRAGVFGKVKDPAEGKAWWVPGGDATLVSVVRRLGPASEGGGTLFELSGASGAAAVCPDLKGQVVSFIPVAGGRELLASLGVDAGYRDELKYDAVLWRPVVTEADVTHPTLAETPGSWSAFTSPADKLEAVAVLWKGTGDQRLKRAVSVTGEGMRIERQYVNIAQKVAPVSPRFSTRWLLALPEPKYSKVSVKAGGLEKLIDLQYAVPGGIKGVKAGEHVKGVDYMDKKWDDVAAVADAEVTQVPVGVNCAGDIVIQLDRGDGVAAVLTTPAAGWESVEIKPVVGNRYAEGGGQKFAQIVSGTQHYLEVTLVGAPLNITAENKTAALPVQTLSAKKVAAAKARSDGSVGSNRSVGSIAKLKLTGPATAINEADGAELVWVPAGEFLRGSPEGQGAGDERPRKTITLDGYWIYKHTITRAQYEKFCAATGRKFEAMWAQGYSANPKADKGQLPVMVNWYEAADYAKWAKSLLPTEAQWEKAARGTDGREYPWGNTWDPDKCVSKEMTLGKCLNGFLAPGSVPAGVSPCGALDMAGNVWEWTADWYDYEYYKTAPDKNPTGPTQGTYKAVRGGCAWFDERFSRTAARFIQPPQARDWTPIGFRCVVNAPGPEGK